VRAPGLARVWRRALAVGPPFGPAHLRAVDAAARLRVPIGLVIAASLALVPGLALPRRAVAAGIIAGYVLLTAWIDRVAARFLVGTRLVDLVLAVIATFVCTLLVPELLAGALCVYLTAVVIDTAIAGLRGALESVPFVLVAAIVAERLVDPAYRLPGAAYMAFAGCLVLSALIIDVLTRERRRATVELDRVQEALRSLTSEPGLDATLGSVVERAREALDAVIALVLLRDADGNLVPAAPGDVPGLPPVIRISGPGPLAQTMERNRPVVIAAIDDERYAPWLRSWQEGLGRWHIRSLLMLPLRAADAVLGVLVVGFRDPEGVAEHELSVMQAFADQAALVITRAQAYERARADAQPRAHLPGGVAHELRTPLTAVKGYLDTVLTHWDRLDDTERFSMLERAAAGARTLAQRLDQGIDAPP